MKTKKKIKLDKWKINRSDIGTQPVLRHLPCNAVGEKWTIAPKSGKPYKEPRWLCRRCNQEAPKEIAFSADLSNCRTNFGSRTFNSLGDMLYERYATEFVKQMQATSVYTSLFKKSTIKASGKGFHFKPQGNDSE